MSEKGPLIQEMHFENGQIELSVKTAVSKLLYEFANGFLKEHNAENFVTVRMQFSDGKEPYYLTMGRCWGKSVDEKYLEKCQELSAKDAERDALKERVKELEEQRSALEKAVPCPECGKNALFVCSLGALNCANCGDHIGWDALAKHEGEKP